MTTSYGHLRVFTERLFELKEREEIRLALEDLDMLERYGLARLVREAQEYSAEFVESATDEFDRLKAAFNPSIVDVDHPKLKLDLSVPQYFAAIAIFDLLSCTRSMDLAFSDDEHSSLHVSDAATDLLNVSEIISYINMFRALEAGEQGKQGLRDQYESELNSFKDKFSQMTPDVARGEKTIESASLGGKARADKYSLEKEQFRKIAEGILKTRNYRKPTKRELARLAVVKMYPKWTDEQIEKKADSARRWL